LRRRARLRIVSGLKAALALLCALSLMACDRTASPQTASPSPTPRRHVLEIARVPDVLQTSVGLTYKLTYSVNGRMAGGALSGRYITYQRPPLRRIDIAYGNISSYLSGTVYFSDTSIVLCPMPYRPPCRELSAEEAMASGTVPIEDLVRTNVALFENAVATDDRIAGQDVTCFKMRPDDQGKFQRGARELDICYTADGLPMRMEFYSTDLELAFEGILLLRDFPAEDAQLPAGALGAP
jgi:hypothetical protein